ncbi:MAG: DNA-processing protein DprA [Mollicutes bacterium]|nr:DNA-processing protein DprA [Mollicutes bacterium]
MDKYVIALLKCKGIGNVKILNYILKYNKNINDILNNLTDLINSDDLKSFNNYVYEAENEIINNRKNGINIISVLNDNYPTKLLLIKDPILYLYYKGNISLINNTSIAIIGSRKTSSEDELLTREVAKKISIQGITIVSGLAIGIDANAHIGSYNEVGKTIAVLPSGLNNIVPSTNKNIADKILNNGGLIVSEYSFNVAATKYTFVKRDRIQAAISDAVIVIKADEKSGTMNAVKIAQSSNKYVTQHSENKNKLISNVFENNFEGILKIINMAKNQIYIIHEKESYEQESLF